MNPILLNFTFAKSKAFYMLFYLFIYMADKNKKNYLWIGIAVVVVIILAIVFNSNSNQPKTNTQEITSINIIDIELQPASQYNVEGSCSNCKKGYYIFPDGTKSCPIEGCNIPQEDACFTSVHANVNINVKDFQNAVKCKPYVQYSGENEYKPDMHLDNSFYEGFNGANKFEYIKIDTRKSYFMKICCTNPYSDGTEVCSRSKYESAICN